MMIIAIFARNKLISIVLINKEKLTMAKPIKETPILYDEDAYRFEMAARDVGPLPDEEVDQMWRDYEEVRKWCAPGVLCNC